MHPIKRQNQATQTDSSGRRGERRTAERVLIIGLDGATFDVLDPLIAEGSMPRLEAAIASGSRGTLHSTVPPITPAAWTSFLTGKQPGLHGIIDFERYDPGSNKLLFNSTRCLDHVRTLWQILGDQGLKVGSITVPMTFPAVPVNGFLVSGFETPGTDSDFVYPPGLKHEILQRWPDPILKTKWKHTSLGGDRVFRENVAYMSRSFHQCAEMTTQLGDRFGWDALMVVLKLVDNLQHKTWKHIDSRWRDRNPRRRDMVKACFAELDGAVGKLLDYAVANRAAVLIVSDHGHGSLEGKVQPNLLLNNWGYLALGDGGTRATTRGRYLWDRMRGKTKRFARVGDVAHDLAVDFSRTRACVMHAGMAGFLYLNLEGRQPGGIVKPKEYETLREELTKRFLGDECRVLNPQGKTIQLFSAVHKPEVLYRCVRAEQPWLPDLLLIPHESLAVVRKIRGRRPLRWLADRRIEGTHRPEGILIVTGDGISHGSGIEAHIVDCAPTILAMLGLGVPDDMSGRVITEIFSTPPTVEKVAAAKTLLPSTSASQAEQVYSDAELAAVTERLSDLGYLE